MPRRRRALPNRRAAVNDQSTDTYQAGGGFIWRNGGLKITGDVAYTESTFINRNVAFNYTLTSTPARHFEFDTAQGVGGGTVTLTNYDLFNPANYRWTGLTQTGNRGHGASWQGRLDLDYKLDRFGITNLQAGLRFSTRDADSYTYSQHLRRPTRADLCSAVVDAGYPDRGERLPQRRRQFDPHLAVADAREPRRQSRYAAR
jgi:iron complex outermembrane receptor protein